MYKRKELEREERFKTFRSSFIELGMEYQTYLVKIESLKLNLMKISTLVDSVNEQIGIF